MSYGRHRAESCPVRLHLVGWDAPGVTTHVVCCGYPRSYPPQLVLEHLVPIVQHRLELVRAGANEAEQSNTWSDHRDVLPSSCEQLSSSVYCHRAARTVAEQHNPSMACHKGVRSSSSESKISSQWTKCAHLDSDHEKGR